MAGLVWSGLVCTGLVLPGLATLILSDMVWYAVTGSELICHSVWFDLFCSGLV